MHRITLVVALIGLPLFAGSNLHAESDLLHVMSFNIRYGTAQDGAHHWRYRRDKVAQLMRESDADIIAVQEAMHFQLTELLALLPEYSVVGVGREGQQAGEYSAILYNAHRLSVKNSRTFWLSETPEKPSASWGNSIFRICTQATFQSLVYNQQFVVFNTHLDHQSQPSRERGMALILERMAQYQGREPVILMGDFNVTDENTVIKLLNTEAMTKNYPALLDSYKEFNPHQQNIGSFNGFGNTPDNQRIDYIFVDRQFKIMNASIITTKIDGLYPSDHYPVTASLLFAEAPTIPPP